MPHREIVLDTETTGLDPAGGDRVVEIGAIELVNHIPTGRTFHHYLNPERPVPADAGSGLHVCFDAPTRKSVDKFHAAALKAGGRDNGKPGLRADYGPDYYAAFVVDPEGYRMEAYCGDKA